MDRHAVNTAFEVLLGDIAAHSAVQEWHQNTHRAYWGDPESEEWKYPRANLPIVIDAEGEEVSEDVQRQVWWDRLVKESNENLVEEDAAASIIQAIMRGWYARKNVTNTLKF